jgi:F-type H+-transporting ATPase subunit b
MQRAHMILGLLVAALCLGATCTAGADTPPAAADTPPGGAAAVHTADTAGPGHEASHAGQEATPAAGDAAHAAGQPAHAAGDASHGSGPNPLRFQSDLALWTAVVFLVLLLVLAKFAWGPIARGLDRREQMIAENIANAERQNEEARRLLAQYEQRLAAAAGEVREILDEARRDAEHTQQQILAKARAEAEAEKRRALQEIERAADQALKDLAERSANLAVDLAGRIVHHQLRAADHAALIQEAIRRFVAVGPSNN